MHSSSARIVLGLAISFSILPAQAERNFLQQIYGVSAADVQPMLSEQAPGFSLLVAARELTAERKTPAGSVRLSVPDIPVRFDLAHERKSGIDLYRLRQAADSEMRGEHIRFTWSFPETYNESMTFDTGALQGQPLFLPDGKVPDNQFTNWGSLFYNRAANLAVGVKLDGAEYSRHARRGYSRFTKSTTLQLMATTGNPRLEIVMFAYRPKDERFWWAEWYQLRSGSDPDIPPNFFPILAPRDLSWQAGEKQTVAVVPAPQEKGRRMELVIIDDIRRQIVSRVPYQLELPVTNVAVAVGDWRSSLYRIVSVPAGTAVNPAENDLNKKLINVFVRPSRAHAQVLFVAPTDAWLAYSTNGGHDYHGWRTGYDGSVGYAPTVMSSRQHRLNNFFYSLYERFNDINHVRYLDELARKDGFEIEYATQHDVARGRVKLDDYKLVLIGNHCEFTTRESDRRFREYMGRGGAVMIHGGDSFAVIVEYLPSLEDPRYIWQRGHVWTHLSDQPSDFKSPQLLPPTAAPESPILNPTPGNALDYLNAFHTSVGYWIPGAKAIFANTVHPIVRGLGVKLGDEVPGPWGGEVDFAYEPRAWTVLLRSDRATPEEREFNVDAFDPTPLHRIGAAIHKNLRLAMMCAENYPNILVDPGFTMYRELYRRTLHYLLENAKKPDPASNVVPAAQKDSALIVLDRPVQIDAMRYELPQFADFDKPDWYRKGSPYAHYIIEGSLDGQHWSTLVDRSHGAWRGMQTDFLQPSEARFLRFDGTFSNGTAFHVKNVQAFAAK